MNRSNCDKLPEAIITDIVDFFDDHLQENPTDYVCVYGSSIYTTERPESDIDLFLVSTDETTSLSIHSIATFIKRMHIANNRKLDEEVPYDNKVSYTQSEVKDALLLKGFHIENGRITVPPVVKSRAFLSSNSIKYRLFLNCLTTPHGIIANSFERHTEDRQNAEKAMTALAINLYHEDSNSDTFTINDLFNTLTLGPNGEAGELFLGYKTDYPAVSEHLTNFLTNTKNQFIKDGLISTVTDETYTKTPKSFNPTEIL